MPCVGTWQEVQWWKLWKTVMIAREGGSGTVDQPGNILIGFEVQCRFVSTRTKVSFQFTLRELSIYNRV